MTIIDNNKGKGKSQEKSQECLGLYVSGFPSDFVEKDLGEYLLLLLL